VKSEQNASKEKLNGEEALALTKDVSKVVITRGKKTLTFQMKDAPSDEELLPLLLGRSGTLRAPTIKRGKTLLVGYSDSAYAEVLK